MPNTHARQPRHTVTAELLIEATRLVVRDQSASVSRIQRRCYVGFATASRLLERMEQLGIVGPPVERSFCRDVLVRPDEVEIVVERIRSEHAPEQP